MKKKIFAMTAAAAVLIITAASGASARQIVLTGEKCPLPMADAIGGEAVVTEIDHLNALGIKDGYVAILVSETIEQVVEGETAAQTAESDNAEAGAEQTANVEEIQVSRIKYVTTDAFYEYIPGFDLSTLPNAEGMTEYRRGNSGDVIFALQDDMVRLGYLAGPADGQLGPNTEGAFNTIKAENGMAADGLVDAVTQWLVMELEDMATGTAAPAVELAYPPVFTVEEKYAAIYDQTDADLTAFLTPDWKFSYDVFEGVGAINNGTAIGTLSLGEKKIDKLDLNATLRVAALRDEKGYVKVAPVVHVETIGAYCPYIQTVQIKAGNQVEEIALLDSARKVEGVNVTEADDLELTEDAVALLAAGGDVVFRLKGVNSVYDLTVSSDTLAVFAEAVKGIV